MVHLKQVPVCVVLLGMLAISCGGTSSKGSADDDPKGADTDRASRNPAPSADDLGSRLDLSVADFDVRGVVPSTLPAPTGSAPSQRSSSSQQLGRSAQRSLLERLSAEAEAELFVEYSGFTGEVSRLTGRGPALTAKSSRPPRKVADGFLARYRALFGLSEPDLARTRLSRRLHSTYSGAWHFTYQFLVGDIDVFKSTIAINVDREGRIINVSGEPIPDAAAHTNGDQARISEAEAIDAAQRAAFIENLRSSRLSGLVYFPITTQDLRLAYRVVVHDADSPNAYKSIVDAHSGQVLWRQTLTHYNHIPTHGSVYTSDSPDPDTPAGSSSGTVSRQDVSFTGALDFPHDDDHYDWWADGSRTTTTSNNVDAYADRDGDNAADSGSRPTAGTGEDFTYPIDLSQEPDTFQDAAVVNLFYWNNRLHDFFYQLGFDEAAKNFQTDNLGLPGSGGDAVMAEAQDNADGDPRSLCNANMNADDDDGIPPRMQMFLCDRTSPERDGDLDVIVIGHEYTHGVHRRLVQTSGAQRSNEGWSDYFGLAIVAEPDDPYAGQYGVGNYLFNKTLGEGIRTFPYSTDASVFQLSYANLSSRASCVVKTCSSDDTETCGDDDDCSTDGDTCDSTSCQFHEDCEPPNTTISQGPCRTQVHYAGSIWANAILRARFNLVGKLGFDAGHEAMNRLVIEGMKVSPDDPTFLDGRNAILEADEEMFGGANRCLIWDAFAKSGMGYSAETTGVDDVNPVEGYDLPAFCAPTLLINTVTDFGNVCVDEVATETLSIFNGGAGELIVTSVEVTSGSSDITLAEDPELPVFVGGDDSHIDFTVRCDPTNDGLATATIRITSNDSENPTRDIVYTCDRGVADINSALAGAGDFGGVCSEDHGDLDLTLFNQGSCDLTISDISLEPSAGSFQLPSDIDLPLVLSRGSDFRLPVRFAPNMCFETEEARVVQVTSNDPDEPVVDIDVAGVSPCPDINLAIADSGDFGNVCAGEHEDLHLTLFNQGRCDLVIHDIELIGGDGSFELPDDLGLPLVLSHDADFLLPVRFAPELCSDVAEMAVLRLTTSDPDEPVVDIGISGSSPCPDLVVDPPSLSGLLAFPATVVDAPEQNLGCFSEQGVNLRNVGACPLVIDSISALGLSDALDYSVIEPTLFPITLPPGEETLGVTVRFTPQSDPAPLAPTEILGELSIVSNDPDGNAVADLCGEAVTGSGARVLVTENSGGTPAPLDVVERIDISSHGVSQPGPVNLTFNDATLSETSVCGRTVRYHVDVETLPTTETTGSDPNSSYEASAKQGSLQTTAQFSLNACEFKEVQLEVRDEDSEGCILLPGGEGCTLDSECCSGMCRGPAGNKTCN